VTTLRPDLIWALGFANAALLYGMAAASLPILIHLLNRRRHREVPWAAMRFLMTAIKQNTRRIRIEHWLLLALRTLVIVSLVLAMAKPFLEQFGAMIPGRRTHRVLVLDGTLSMGYTVGEASRFEQAKALASQLVKDSPRGDAISLILMGGPPRVVIGDPSPNLDEVRREIGELSQSHTACDLRATFEAVDRVLEASTIPQKEVVFVTDLQATSWRPPASAAESGGEGWTQLLARIEARRPRSVLIDLGKSGGENCAVVDLEVPSPVATAGSNTLIRGVVRNFGRTKVEGLRARLTVDGRLGPEQPVDVAPGEEVPVVFNHRFEGPGEHQVEVAIDDDPLALDNRRRLVVPVREAINVLLVDGHFKSEPYQAETDYLAQALNPSEALPGSGSYVRAEVVTESQLARRDLSPYDVVVLCNVSQFRPEEVSALEDFLRQAGGVVIFGGDQVSADNYNRLLYVDGKGLLPAAVGPSRGDASRREGGIGFDPLGYRHPIIGEFLGQADTVLAGLNQVLIFQHHRLTLPKDSDAQVALAFADGDPAIIEAPRYRGTVIQVATSADAGWSTWPLHYSYLPVMQQIVLQACAGRLSERNIRVGQPYDQAFPAAGAGSPATVTTPANRSVATRLQAAGGVSQFHFEPTDLAGTYQVQIGPPLAEETSFAANPDPAESDLDKVDRAAVAEAVPGWNFLYLTNWRELTENSESVGRRGEFHRPFLYAVLALLLVESFAAWKFGHHE
jgi:hypothetical protein